MTAQSLLLLLLTLGSNHSAFSHPLKKHYNSNKVILKPIYVGGGQTILLRHGCTLSLFDAGGGDKQGFERLQSEYKMKKNPEKFKDLNYMIISHAHRDHNKYIPKIAEDKIKINTLISNKKVQLKKANRGIDKLIKPKKQIYHSVSTKNYQTKTFELLDRKKCNEETLYLDLLWGSTLREEMKSYKGYLRKKENNDSVVVGIRGEITPVLFLGDTNIPAQKLLMKHAKDKLSLYKNGIIVAGHHGWGNGYYKDLYAFLNPKKIIISRHIDKLMQKDVVDSMSEDISGNSGTTKINVLCTVTDKRSKKTRKLNLKQIENCETMASDGIILLSPNRELNIEL